MNKNGVDICLINGNVITMSDKLPRAEAIAIRGEKILAVGTSEEILSLVSKSTRVIDLKGKTVLPGFIDTHVHLTEYGLLLSSINLKNVRSIAEMKEKISDFSKRAKKDEWIIGFGWDEGKLAEKRPPTRWDLDEASPENPVVVFRVCGHVCTLNSRALEKLNITEKTPPPPGGEIDKDPKTGQPTGILKETAAMMVTSAIPLSDERLYEILKAACKEAIRHGLTSVHCIVKSIQEIRAFQRMLKSKELPLRVHILPFVNLLHHVSKLKKEFERSKDYLSLGALKIILDGSLGARTAALTEPYSDDPDNTGILWFDQTTLNEIVYRAHKDGIQVAIHCIGDKAVEVALNAIEEALRRLPREDHRHRIEHASLLNSSLIKRLRRLRVIASVQPHFIVSDKEWLPSRLGPERIRHVYPFKTMIDNGILLTGSSDCPVEPINPLSGIRAAVERNGFFPEEALSVNQAIRMYTINAAYSSFDENKKGSIEPRKFADLVVLSKDPFEVPKGKIDEIEVEMTIVGGKIVYAKESLLTS
ncbi:MAG: amidohydrolase [Candidatus Baldrarchaeia archaeon]